MQRQLEKHFEKMLHAAVLTENNLKVDPSKSATTCSYKSDAGSVAVSDKYGDIDKVIYNIVTPVTPVKSLFLFA